MQHNMHRYCTTHSYWTFFFRCLSVSIAGTIRAWSHVVLFHKRQFRDRQFCTQYFVNICERRCTQRWCIVFYGSLRDCFDQPLILTQLFIHSKKLLDDFVDMTLELMEISSDLQVSTWRSWWCRIYTLPKVCQFKTSQNVLTVKSTLKINRSWTKALNKK